LRRDHHKGQQTPGDVNKTAAASDISVGTFINLSSDVVPVETSAVAGGSMEVKRKNMTLYTSHVLKPKAAVNYSRLSF
jgi:hypothetical protein